MNPVMFPFVNRWARVVCTRCGRTLLPGERGFAAFDSGNARPHTPHWCFGCRVAIGADVVEVRRL